MEGLFTNADTLISEALSLKPHQKLRQKTISRNVELSPETVINIEALVPKLYAQIEQNWQGRLPSKPNWQLRRVTSLAAHNLSPEVLLERAIVILAQRGLLEGWYNQMPIASGLINQNFDKKAAVDWVRYNGDSAELIELKCTSDTPLYAAFEILRYGLAYLFCYLHRKEFGFEDYPLMQLHKLSLKVLAPHEFYNQHDLSLLATALETGLRQLFHEKTRCVLETGFSFSSFPAGFELPFTRGEEVSAYAHLPADSPAIVSLLDAINRIQPVLWNKL
jgi:hypothetical protein